MNTIAAARTLHVYRMGISDLSRQWAKINANELSIVTIWAVDDVDDTWNAQKENLFLDFWSKARCEWLAKSECEKFW